MQTILKSLIIALFVIIQFDASAQSNSFKLEVKEEKGDCVGVAPMQCYLVKYYNSKDWEYFYAPIQGFDYQAGTRYSLRVKRTKIENPPADAPSYKYELVKILNKKTIKTNNKEQSTSKLNLGDKKWFVTELNGKAVQTKNAYIRFDNSSKHYSASMGCNTLNGAFIQNGSSVNLKAGISTMMACDPAVMQLESSFANLLGHAYTVESVDNGFVFKSGNKIVLKVQSQTTEQELAFLGKHKWKLFFLHGEGRDYGNVSIEFDAKESRVFGNSGCNTFRGPVKIAGDKLIFGALASTKMACIDPEKADVEHKLMALFADKNLRFDIAEQTFNIYQGDRTVATFGIDQSK